MIPLQDHDGVLSILDGFPGSELSSQVSCMPDKQLISQVLATNSEDWREVSFLSFFVIDFFFPFTRHTNKYSI